MQQEGAYNPGFVGDNGKGFEKPFYIKRNENFELGFQVTNNKTADDRKPPLPSNGQNEMQNEEHNTRQSWGSGMDFLMSCIAMSVGLGNVWRFPFTAYENGGGAFLIPYIIVLFLVGKPAYFLEMIIGQFTNRSSVKMWSLAPIFRGVGWAQMFSMIAVGTYYCSLMSLTMYYLVNSFETPLPWSECRAEWGDGCVDSTKKSNESVMGMQNVTNMTTMTTVAHQMRSSAELYFTKTVLKEKLSIVDGIGYPDVRLMIYLFIAWLCIFCVLARGVKSTGKVAYFLAIFPYIIMIALLLRAVTLEGAVRGIIFFISPNWNKLFEAQVWYAAVTQCFFSLAVCFGGLVTYGSYNDFRHNIYRDVIVITTMDTFTSIIAGFTIFGILGNLAHELDTDVGMVVRKGAGLAFVSYPDAISKFAVLPQLFSVLFFLMLYILGIGSAIAIAGGIISIINDQFPTWKHWHIVLATCVIGFAVGTIYCTPGGQWVLSLVDHYAASFVVFVLASLEVTGVFWIYGLENLLDDIEFMLNMRPSFYWRICWAIVTPLFLIGIFVYWILNFTPLMYGDTLSYPPSAHVIGWSLSTFGLMQVPIWMLYAFYSKRELGIAKAVMTAFKPNEYWRPIRQSDYLEWKSFKDMKRQKREKRTASKITQFIYVLLGREREL